MTSFLMKTEVVATGESRSIKDQKMAVHCCQYLLDENEKKDYVEWCDHHDKDPNDIANNTSHIFACALLALGYKTFE